jgi:hypothetical protein
MAPDKEDTGTGTKDDRASPHTADIRGDRDAKRRCEYVVRRRARNGEGENPAHGDRCGVRRDAKSYDGRHNHKGPWGYRDRGKTSRLAARLTEVLEPTAVRVVAPTKTAELRVVGIDISVSREELR